MPGVAVVVAECVAFGHGDFRLWHVCGGGVRVAGYSATIKPTSGDGQCVGGKSPGPAFSTPGSGSRATSLKGIARKTWTRGNNGYLC